MSGQKITTEAGVMPDYPRPITGPFHIEAETGSSTSSSIALDQSTNINKPMPYIVLAILLSGLAVGAEVMRLVNDSAFREQEHQLMDAKIKSSIAKSEAEANAAKVEAKIASKEVEKICAALKAAKIGLIDCS